MASGPSLLVDLRVAQAYRERGIPRYCQALVLALAHECPTLEIACLIDADRDPPLRLDELASHARIIAGRASIAGEGQRFTHYLQSAMADSHKTVQALFPAELAAHRPRLGAIVYDLIPWLFPEMYLGSAGFYHPYMRVLPALAHLDRLFAISESTRRDVIAIANVDPSRIVTIYGGLDEGRWAVDAPRTEADETRTALDFQNGQGERFRVSRPFWLYVGGEDFRKNLPRLIEAAALLKRRDRLDAPLVVACFIEPHRRAELLSSAAMLGLTPGTDVILTGYVSDETLGTLFARCMATVFPSTYEGLGLPVLDSYAFGKPALASDSSSLKELVPEECRFDPYSAASIADAMDRLRDDPRVAAASRAFAPGVMAMCTWSAAARKFGEWLDEPAAATPPPRRSMWVVTSLPPGTTEPATDIQNSLAAPDQPVTFFSPIPDRAGLEAARLALARARHHLQREAARADVIPLDVLVEARHSTTTQPVLFVVGDSGKDHQGAIDYLLTHGAAPRDAVHVHDVSLCRLLVQEAGVRRFIVDSAAAADLLRGQLGDDASQVRIDVAETSLAERSPGGFEARLRELLELDVAIAAGPPA